MTRGPVLVSSLFLLPNIIQAKVLLVQTVTEEPEIEISDGNTKGQDYGTLVNFVHGLGFKLKPNSIFYNSFKTKSPVKQKRVLQPKTANRNPVQGPINTTNWHQQLVPPSEGKQEEQKCQKMSSNQRKNTRMKRRHKSRKLKGKKLRKVPWGHWIKSYESRTGDRVQTSRKFCCTRGRKVGKIVKKRSSCRGRRN